MLVPLESYYVEMCLDLFCEHVENDFFDIQPLLQIQLACNGSNYNVYIFTFKWKEKRHTYITSLILLSLEIAQMKIQCVLLIALPLPRNILP